MTTFKTKHWTLRNNNTVLPVRSSSITSSDGTPITSGKKTPLSSPALSDRPQHRSAILQLHCRPSTYIHSDVSSSSSAPTSQQQQNSSSALKHLIPSISSLNFPTISATDTNNETTFLSAEQQNDINITKVNDGTNDSHANNDDDDNDDPPIFDCDDEQGVNNKYKHIQLEPSNNTSLQHGIRPVQILMERLEAWYILIKQLYHYFNELANVENQVSKAYIRLLQNSHVFGAMDNHNSGDVSNENNEEQKQQQQQEETSLLLNVHFGHSPQGMRHLCQLWQTRHDGIAKGHTTMSTFIKSNVLPSLSGMKRELKGMIRSIRMDDRLKLSKLARLRREAKRRVLRLDRQLAFFEQHSHHGDGKQDPWLLNAAVVNQMLKVYHQTNKMHETILRLQKEVMISEQRIVQEFRQLCQDMITIQEQQTCLGIDQHLQHIMQTIDQLQADGDWNDFVQRFKHHLISDHARYRHPNQLHYTNHAHPLLQPVFASRMERNSSVLHRWHEHIYVLTPAGFLHEYRNPRTYPGRPDTTVFIPHYNVSTLSTNLHHNLIFQLQRAAVPPNTRNPLSLSRTNTTASSSTSLTSRSSSSSSAMSDKHYQNVIKTTRSKTLTFRAKSAPDMQAWLEHLTELSYRYRPSVSYNAPAFLQPSNATNPEYFVTSPPATPSSKVPQQQQNNDESSVSKSAGENSNNNNTTASLFPSSTVIKVGEEVPKQEENKTEDNWCQNNPWTISNNKMTATISSPTTTRESSTTSPKEKKDDETVAKEEEKKEEPRSFFLAGVTLPKSMQ
ncbi:hypothetical protein BDA99DRAFT_601763 [Phascolomyces articulosus]|uniref:PH domain-containing protein n=1 Tax=Phascolomyces articulosus TaxID=60185 RepID=A0AAD5PJZ7_9FUNG|nr:hypothetical protein BDA99DRAFT_601763 [Phascolomyces articulosus]